MRKKALERDMQINHWVPGKQSQLGHKEQDNTASGATQSRHHSNSAGSEHGGEGVMIWAKDLSHQ